MLIIQNFLIRRFSIHYGWSPYDSGNEIIINPYHANVDKMVGSCQC